jgi:hypothetical protein
MAPNYHDVMLVLVVEDWKPGCVWCDGVRVCGALCPVFDD